MTEITIGGKKYKVREARTEEEKEKGLQGVKELPEDEGMLFYFDPPEDVSIWMHNTLIPLDIVFIDDDERVVTVAKGVPRSDRLITVKDIAYVLEVNRDSGIEGGDELEFEDDQDEGPVMKILAPDGSSQMDLWGGERIFSRRFTRQLIGLVKKTEGITDEKELEQLYRRIGRKMFREIEAQNNRKPEYVEAPEKPKEESQES